MHEVFFRSDLWPLKTAFCCIASVGMEHAFTRLLERSFAKSRIAGCWDH